jgi:hypothetical protein
LLQRLLQFTLLDDSTLSAPSMLLTSSLAGQRTRPLKYERFA